MMKLSMRILAVFGLLFLTACLPEGMGGKSASKSDLEPYLGEWVIRSNFFDQGRNKFLAHFRISDDTIECFNDNCKNPNMVLFPFYGGMKVKYERGENGVIVRSEGHYFMLQRKGETLILTDMRPATPTHFGVRVFHRP